MIQSPEPQHGEGVDEALSGFPGAGAAGGTFLAEPERHRASMIGSRLSSLSDKLPPRRMPATKVAAGSHDSSL